jgi:ABC-2 type transport system ATP-binding protein
MNIISVENLNKNFGTNHALRNVSFVVKKNSVTGFLGPNGAGKSTTINILLGFINKTSGSVRIFDHAVNVNSIETRRNVGFLNNNMSLDRTLTVEQELKHYGYLAGNYNKKYVHKLAEQLDLNLNTKISGLSTGNYQKVGLIIALMNRPKLLILDEPTNGLDPLVQAEFNKIILELKKNGSTIFISSHILSEIETLCDELIFIKQGQIAAQITRREIAAESEQVISIKPKNDERAKILKFLDKNHINYNLETGDLEQTFMKFYDNDTEIK